MSVLLTNSKLIKRKIKHSVQNGVFVKKTFIITKRNTIKKTENRLLKTSDKIFGSKIINKIK